MGASMRTQTQMQSQMRNQHQNQPEKRHQKLHQIKIKTKTRSAARLWQVSTCLVWLACAACLATIGQQVEAGGFDLNLVPDGFQEWWHNSEPAPAVTTSAQSDQQQHDDPMEVEDKQQQQGPLASVQGKARRFLKRARDSLPSYFSFEQFVTKFKRHYSKSEAWLRKSIFMRKIVEVCKGRIDFRLGRLGYMQEVNKFSDMTPGEFRLMFQAEPPPSYGKSRSRKSKTTTTTRTTTDEEEEASAFEYRKRLSQQQERLKRPDEVYLMDILTQSSGMDETEEERATRLLDEHIHRIRRELARETDANELQVLMESAIREELSGMDFERISRGAGGQATRELPWPGRFRSPDYMDTDSGSGQDEGEGDDQQVAPYRPPGGDQLPQALDWSQHPCFHTIYDQGKACGSCYVYATTTLAEFFACTELGANMKVTRRKFSKEFVLSCAQKFTPTVMGCAGGSIYDTLRFIAVAGVNKIYSWRDTFKARAVLVWAQAAGHQPDALDLRCPLNPGEQPFSEWGSIKVTMNPVRIHPNEWLQALEDAPIAVSVQMPAVGVDSYAGGVHDGAGCATSGLWHAMLLVGYGVSERGEPYWRFRNSFGPDWGDEGHFNLAMDIPDACLRESVRVYREPCRSC